MGFTTGFTGGVTLVLGTAYLTLQAHQRIRTHQAETLRAQTFILSSLSYIPASAPRPTTVAEELALLEYQQELLVQADHRRAGRRHSTASSFVERAKERWNAEVEGAVRWATTVDWVAAREDAERVALQVWARATGGEMPAETARRAGAAVGDSAGTAAEAARRAVESGAMHTREAVQSAAGEAKGAGVSIWERGFQKGREVADKAKAAVGVAEVKAHEKAHELASAVRETDVEKVLQQRFEKKSAQLLDQSVEEVLEERYKPIAQQDPSKLRGL